MEALAPVFVVGACIIAFLIGLTIDEIRDLIRRRQAGRELGKCGVDGCSWQQCPAHAGSEA